MFPGDEDNGEMGAWYILSAIGLYNLSPGSDEFIFGSPLFNRVEIDISDSTSMFYNKSKEIYLYIHHFVSIYIYCICVFIYK